MHQPNRSSPRGFTLIELLVVIAIIALLAAILTVAYRKAFGAADKFRIAAQLQTISTALEAYKTDHGSYPVTSLDDSEQIGGANLNRDDKINAPGIRGARVLAKALMGPQRGANPSRPGTAFDYTYGDQDGKDGFGFAVPPRSGSTAIDDKGNADKSDDELVGKKYGPYLAVDKFVVAKTTLANDGEYKVLLSASDDPDYKNYDDTTVLLDANDNPILYFPVLNPAPSLTRPTAVPSPTEGSFIGIGPRNGNTNRVLPMYRWDDNCTDVPVASLKDGKRRLLTRHDFSVLLGDVDGATQNDGNPDGYISSWETPRARGKFILISAGPDGFFGVNHNDPRVANLPPKEQRAKIDDVTNFDGD